MSDDPHGGRPVLRAGPEDAGTVLVLFHGRGAGARDVLGLWAALERPDLGALAPEAAGNSWWPNSFLAPLAANQPWIDSALAAGGAVLDGLAARGVGPERIVLGGFSQGACLAAELAARRAAPWKGVAILSGALIGTEEAGGPGDPALYGHAPKRLRYGGDLNGARVAIRLHERRHRAQIGRAHV